MREQLLDLLERLKAIQADFDALKGPGTSNVPSVQQAMDWIIGQFSSGRV